MSIREDLEANLSNLAGQFQEALRSSPEDSETIYGLFVAAQRILESSTFDQKRVRLQKLTPRSRQEAPRRDLRTQWSGGLPEAPEDGEFPSSPLPAQQFFRNIHQEVETQQAPRHVLSDPDPIEEEYEEEQQRRRPVKKKRRSLGTSME